jgi:hypothetical protein
MGCNCDLTGAYKLRLWCDPCITRKRNRARAESDRAKRDALGVSQRAMKQLAEGRPVLWRGKWCSLCMGMPHRRPVAGCPSCHGLHEAEHVELRADRGLGCWVRAMP